MARAKKSADLAKSKQLADKSPAEEAGDEAVIEDAVVVAEVPAKAGGEPKAGYAVVPLVVGGVIAGAIGFAAATFLGDAPVVVDTSASEQAVAGLAAQTGALDTEIAALKSDIATLKSQASALKQVVADAPSRVVINGLGKRQDQADRLGVAQAELIAAIGERLAGMENRPVTRAGAPVQVDGSLAAELAALRKFVTQGLQNLEAAQAEAGGMSDRVTGQLAFAAVVKAVDNGAAFETALAELRATGADVPPVLTQAAREGAVTLAELQDQFPDAARAALNAELRTQVEQGGGSRLGAFVRIQLGARSLQPRDGDSADAVLSRAEAALKDGRVAQALDEIELLSAAGLGEMASWAELARSRQDIVDGLAELSTLLGN